MKARNNRIPYRRSLVGTLLRTGCLALLLACLAVEAPVAPSTESGEAGTESVIVQGAAMESLVAAVHAVGGRVTHELGIIRAVGAEVTPEQLAALRKVEGLRISDNKTVAVESAVCVSGYVHVTIAIDRDASTVIVAAVT